MKVIAIGEVVDANKALETHGVAAKVHLHDACGRQTLSLEALDGSAETLEAARGAVQDFFSRRGTAIEFDPVEGRNFWPI